MGGELPDLRASDAERERAAELLRHAAGEGRLTVEELDERLDLVYAARTGRELERLVQDVVPAGARTASLVPEGAPARLPVVAGEGGTGWVVGILGGSDRRGRWRVARRCRVVNVMGGSDLDLNDAELAAEEVEIRVFSLMGGSTVRVPDGLNVEVSEFAVMGGNNIRLGAERPDPGGPVVRLRIVSIMGGTDVRRGRRRSRRERRRRHGVHPPPEAPRLP